VVANRWPASPTTASPAPLRVTNELLAARTEPTSTHEEDIVPAYMIFDNTITEPEGFAEYVRRAGPTVTAHGGRFLVGGGAVESLEGGWAPPLLVVLAFDSAEQARAWWTSAEYEQCKPLRHRTATTRALLVEGTGG
jgi:uncharacterized protein (DUF1330 family)